MQGLEKYVMTKLFSRTFASVPEDAKIDRDISHKICLLQTFLKPDHLDIPAVLHNEASWLVRLLLPLFMYCQFFLFFYVLSNIKLYKLFFFFLISNKNFISLKKAISQVYRKYTELKALS
jgi:hypothetical protein